MGFDECQKIVHKIAKEKGFWDHTWNNPSILGEKLALIHSEISEALEANRDGNKELEEEELADTIIRILDYAEYQGYSMDKAVQAKIEKNRNRETLHGRKW